MNPKKPKDLLGSLQVPQASATGPRFAPGAEGSPLLGNTMKSAIINQSIATKELVGSLREENEKLKAMHEQGMVDVEIDVSSIDRPQVVMRSKRYWETQSFLDIKDSIQRNGLQDPITVRPSTEPGRYILVKGDTRLTSHEHLFAETGEEKWLKIRARVEQMSEDDAILKMVVENRDRADVRAYDQAIFYTSLVEEKFQNRRQEMMENLNISKSWLSRILIIGKTVPPALVDAFPALYDAGITTLYPLAQTLQEHQDKVQAMIEQAEGLTESAPAAQAERLRRFAIETGTDEPRQKQPAAKQQLTARDGKILCEFKPNKTGLELKISDKEMPGFAELVKDRLESLYEEWRQSQQSEPDNA